MLLLVAPAAYAGMLPDDIVATGDDVVVVGGSEGRVFGAGWKVKIEDGNYEREIIAIGADIHLEPHAKKPVYIFGQKIVLSGHYASDVAAVGQEIILMPDAKIDGKLWLSGQKVWLQGSVVANGKILANRVLLEGNVLSKKGKVLDVQAKELDISETAKINGDILYRAQEAPRVDGRAKVLGNITLETASFEDELREKLEKIAFLGKLGSKLMLLVWLLLAGFAITLFMTPKVVASMKRVHENPLRMMGVGFGFLVIIPIAAVFLLLTVIGMPVAISMMASYPLAIIMGFSIGTLWLGTLIYKLIFRKKPYRRHQLLGCYLMAMPLVVGLTQVPYMGIIGWLLPLTAGLGALSWLKWQQMQAGKE